MLPRTPSLNELFREIASQNMVFPAYESWRDFAKDLLSVRREVNDRTRTERFRATGTDDFLHVANYANIAKRMLAHVGSGVKSGSTIARIIVASRSA
jgi:hypothetical protein